MVDLQIELLQAMPLFGGINKETLTFLLERSRIVSVPQGQYFFREGDPGNALYILQEGEVAIIKSWQGQNYVLRQLKTGDAFGEMALIDLFPRSAAVRVTHNAKAIELTHDLLYDIYEKDLEQFTLIQMNVGRELSRRLRVADELLFKAKMGKSVSADDQSFHAL